jgi:methyl-accepting chemotaxis protein
VDAVAAAGRAGRLHDRADSGALEGDFRSVVDGLNGVLAAVSEPMDEAAQVLRRVAGRDLTARMRKEYAGKYAEMKVSLNEAVENVEETVREVEGAAERVAAVASQIADNSEMLARGATTQASSLEEVSSSLHEMTAISRRNADNTGEGHRISEQASEDARQGMESMARLSGAMERIKESSDATSRIVKTIDEIAFQTNLLALNASVEAARAGTAGKGFAVVAGEVRNLALRSAEAARDTATLIEESVGSTDEGGEVLAEVLARLEELSGGVGRVREVMADIAAASEQQTGGVDQINEAVQAMSGVTQTTAAGAEESAGEAEELDGQARRLREIVRRFTLSREAHGGTAGLPGHGAPAASTDAGARWSDPVGVGGERDGAGVALM